MDNSFIKLYRSLLDWEWWDDKNVTRLFLTILLMVNWQDKNWHGITIKAGSTFTSVDHLAKKSGLTISQTRTALNKLKSTGEISSKTANNGQLVTVENWAKFQFVPENIANEISSDITNQSQTDIKRVSNEYQQLKKDNKYKNINNIKNDSIQVGQRYIDPITGRIRMRIR